MRRRVLLFGLVVMVTGLLLALAWYRRSPASAEPRCVTVTADIMASPVSVARSVSSA
jgi:hypothetical protein